MTLENLKDCFDDAEESVDEAHVPCKCGASCHEMSIKHKHTKNKDDIGEPGMWFNFDYKSYTFTDIKEIPSYPATKFVTDIGGWLGLFSGISFLSIIEILLFLFLSMLAMVQKLKHAIQVRRGQRHELPPV